MSNQLQVSGEAKIRAIQGPVVANSGVITALDGDASEYVRGDGTLADFPTSTGGGSSVSYYLNTSVSQGTIGGVAYKQLSKTPISGAGTDVTISANGYIASYITDANDPALLEVPAGNFNCEFYFSVNSNSHNPYVYAELYKYDGTTFTLLGSNVAIPQYLTNGTTLSAYYFAIPVATSVLTVTDRISIRIYVNVDGRTVTLHTENNHLCQVVTTFSKGLISLNNLTRQNQFFGTGTSGTDFNISSVTATHTFNLPVASAANTGKLSSTDWSTFNGKVPYTGATADVNLGANFLKARTFYAEGNGGGGSYAIKNGATPSFEDGYTILSSNDYRLNILSTVSTVTKAVYLGFSGVTATRTFTLPDASGTIALTSDLSSYVPYTGATGSVNLGSYALTASALNVTNTSTFNGNIILKKVGLSVSSPLYVTQFAATTGVGIGYSDGTGGANFILQTAAIYDYTFPAATGTIALTSNLSSYVPYTGATANVDLGIYSLTSTGVTVKKSSGLATISFPVGGNDPAFIQHQESIGDIGIMRFSVSDNDDNTDYFVFGNTNGTAGAFLERFKITSNGIVTIGTWQGTPIADAYISSAATWNAKQNAITLTTTGTSGAATFVSNTLNIPNYGSALSGYIPYTGTGISVYGLSAIGEYDGGAQIPAGYGGNYALTLGNGAIGNGLSLYTTGYIDAGAIRTAGFSRVTNATASTSTTTGAFVVTGGVGIGGALYGTSATFTNTSGGSTTSALRLSNNSASASSGSRLEFHTTDAVFNAIDGVRTTGGSGGELRFWTMNSSGTLTQNMTITSGGNVGIGTNSPSAYSHGGTNLVAEITNSATSANAQAHYIISTGAAANTGSIGTITWALPNSSAADKRGSLIGSNIESNSSSAVYTNLTFATNAGGSPTERMRITSDAKILMGTTTYGGVGNSFDNGGGIIVNYSGTGSRVMVEFKNNNGTIGSISGNGTVTTYNVTSDYRLKQDFKDYNALDLVSNIKTYDYEWKSDKRRMYGVIAHELQEVLPYAVQGEKDELESDGNIKAQSVDYSKLTPINTKAIQELYALVQEQKAQIEELKALINK